MAQAVGRAVLQYWPRGWIPAAPDGPTLFLAGSHLAQTACTAPAVCLRWRPAEQKGARVGCSSRRSSACRLLKLAWMPLTLQACRLDTAASEPHTSHDDRLSAQGCRTSAWSVENTIGPLWIKQVPCVQVRPTCPTFGCAAGGPVCVTYFQQHCMPANCLADHVVESATGSWCEQFSDA